MPLSLNSKESLASCRDVQALVSAEAKRSCRSPAFEPLCFLTYVTGFWEKPVFITAQRDLLMF
jgi:hypothetical protein